MKNKKKTLPVTAVDTDARQILHTRAQALSKPPEQLADADSSLEVLEFRLAQERYALETRHVSEVYPLKDMTVLPCVPAFIVGIVNVRGRITPVIDIKKFFGLPDKGLTDLHRIILIRSNGLEFGLLADTIVGIEVVAIDMLQAELPTFTGIRSDYLKGVTADRLVVLDMEHILADPKIIVCEEIEA